MRRRQQISAEVRAALRSVPRERFLPEDLWRLAAEDRPLPLGHGQTNSQPTTVAHMMTLLEAQPGEKILDVGCGSGWTTGLLGHLVGRTGTVCGVELIDELVDTARHNLAPLGQEWVGVTAALEGVLGLPERAPFDKILVSAEARRLPEPLVDQLASPGRMVVPVSERMVVVDRDGSGRDTVRRLGRYSFVPLIWQG
ncbi:MAG: protein-L-isoaspartate O-methyltransferase [Actinomycetota bacterium]|nr:protein-L-isoaspartate O-methyltransferase [Actinomycetota bacterium]